MATAQEYATWIVKNQDKRDTPEFNTVAEAYKLARAGSQTPTVTAEEPSMAERVGRFAGLGARGVVRGVAALPTLLAEGAASPLRGLTGGRYFQSPSAVLEQTLSQAGLPEPATPTERIATDVTGALAGLGGQLGLAQQLAQGSELAKQFARNPLSQLIAGTTGSTAASLAREEGVGPSGQLAAGVAGAVAPSLAASTVSTGLRVGKALIDPTTQEGQKRIVGKLLNEITGAEAPAVRERMKAAAEIIPGSRPTAAQVAQSGGIAAQERAVSGEIPGRYATRMMEQNAARLNALRAIAKTETDVLAAETAREAQSKPLYDAATKVMVDADGTLRKLLSRPSVKAAWSRAQNVAKENNETIQLGAKGLERYSGKGLHYLKMGLDDLLDDPTSSIGKFEKRAIMQTRDELGKWLADKIPAYAKARETHAAMSRPIDQMKLGQALLQKLEPALTEGNLPVRMRASSFAEALRKGDDLAKQITGFRGATLKNTLAPEQIATLHAVRDDLARAAIAGDLGRGVGSNTFQNIAQENLFQAAGLQGLPQLLSRPVQLTNYALRGIYGSANREMKDKLLELLLEPPTAALAMEPQASGLTERLAGLLARGRNPVVSSAPYLMTRP